ncbi:hypothetical protein [Comamonas thiooxydans]|uniref:hypothetical protein n=1 Tax=Comamonas thiooxydans TaxID=363952 RepID=UPI00209BDBC5|nr:hypothetical protein [Comamonas thiooxydans]MCO8250157.1 hypothetical protein [Comamonas thiooxydans]
MSEAQHTAALANLRHLYKNLATGGVQDAEAAKRIAEGLLAPAISALESGHTPKRSPLTLEQISKALGGDVQEGSFPLACTRLIERAHGITDSGTNASAEGSATRSKPNLNELGIPRAELHDLVTALRLGDATALKAAEVIEKLSQLKKSNLRRIPVLGVVSGEDDVVFIKKLDLPPGTTWG